MSVNLIMRPDIAGLTREEFRAFAGRYAIGVDGFVKDGPYFDPEGPIQNFNHHERVSRLETRATCAQALLAVRMGLFQTFRDANGPRADIYANDCDEDVCMTVNVLQHGYFCESTINPLLNKLVSVAELMDTTAGLYPISTDSQILRHLAWIMQPYRSFRSSGQIDRKNAEDFVNVVTNVGYRIQQYLMGQAEEVSLDTRYKIIGGGPGWSMIEEIGPYGRQRAFADGVRAFVAVRQISENRWAYSAGRASEYIRFPLETFMVKFNKLEPGPHYWGGGTTIIGSPRVSPCIGSVISPIRLQKVINRCLSEEQLVALAV